MSESGERRTEMEGERLKSELVDLEALLLEGRYYLYRYNERQVSTIEISYSPNYSNYLSD